MEGIAPFNFFLFLLFSDGSCMFKFDGFLLYGFS